MVVYEQEIIYKIRNSFYFYLKIIPKIVVAINKEKIH